MAVAQRSTYYLRGIKATVQSKRHNLLSHQPKDISCALISSSPFDVASEDVGHSKRDDDLQFTRWTGFYVDRAYTCTRIVKVLARKTPQILRNRCVRRRSLEKFRACYFLNRCAAEISWVLYVKTSGMSMWGKILARTAAREGMNGAHARSGTVALSSTRLSTI